MANRYIVAFLVLAVIVAIYLDVVWHRGPPPPPPEVPPPPCPANVSDTVLPMAHGTLFYFEDRYVYIPEPPTTILEERPSGNEESTPEITL